MSTSPLRPTSEVFDETVMKVEFLPLPTQIPDFALNLNTESLYNRLQTIMKEVVGPIRTQGFNVHLSAGNMLVDAGLILHGNYVVRLLTQQSFALVATTHVIYATITEHLLTSVTDPTIVNINPPLTADSLPGPSQYRFTVAIGYGTSIPADTAGVVHFKICDVSAAGVVSNLLPLYTRKLGTFDLATMEAAPGVVQGVLEGEISALTTRVASVESSTGGPSVVVGDTAMAAGDFFKIIDSSGPKAQKALCSMFPGAVSVGTAGADCRADVWNESDTMTVKLDSTHVATVIDRTYVENKGLYITIGTYSAGSMTYSNLTALGVLVPSYVQWWIGALDATHIALFYMSGTTTTCARVITIVSNGASYTQTADATYTVAYANSAPTGVILDSTHFVIIQNINITGNLSIRATVATYTGSAVTLGSSYDKAWSGNSEGYYCKDGAVALSNTLFFVPFGGTSGGQLYGLAASVSGNTITWGNVYQNGNTNVSLSNCYARAAYLSATKVAVTFNTSLPDQMVCIATLSGTTVTWVNTAQQVFAASGCRISIAALDSTHFVLCGIESGYGDQKVGVIDGSNNITFGATVAMTGGSGALAPHVVSFSSSAFIVTTWASPTWRFSQLGSVSGTTITAGNVCKFYRDGGWNFEGYAALDSSTVIWVGMPHGGAIEARVLTLSGTTLTANAVASTPITMGYLISVAALSATSFVVMYYSNATTVKCVLATISGTTITFGSETQVNTGTANDTYPGCLKVAALSSSSFIAMWGDGSNASVRAASVSGTTPTFGTEVTGCVIASSAVANTIIVHSATAANVFADYYTGSGGKWSSCPLTLSGTAITKGTVEYASGDVANRFGACRMPGIKVGGFAVIRTAEFFGSSPMTEYAVLRVFKILASGQVQQASTLSIPVSSFAQSGTGQSEVGQNGLIALGTNRFGLVYPGTLGETFQPFRITDGGAIIQDGVPIIVQATGGDAINSVGVSSSFAIIAGGYGSCRHFVDDRYDIFGIMQEAGTTGQTKRASVLGGTSSIHSNLVPGRRYGISTALVLTLDESPFIGIAASTTQLLLKGGA